MHHGQVDGAEYAISNIPSPELATLDVATTLVIKNSCAYRFARLALYVIG